MFIFMFSKYCISSTLKFYLSRVVLKHQFPQLFWSCHSAPKYVALETLWRPYGPKTWLRGLHWIMHKASEDCRGISVCVYMRACTRTHTRARTRGLLVYQWLGLPGRGRMWTWELGRAGGEPRSQWASEPGLAVEARTCLSLFPPWHLHY